MTVTLRYLAFASLIVSSCLPEETTAARVVARPRRIPVNRRMPAEFERQAAILIGWDGADFTSRDVQLALISACRGNIVSIILVKSQADQQDAVDGLASIGISDRNVRFVRVPLDSPWTRDYGPTILQGSFGSSILIDAGYDQGQRPNDDDVPAVLSRLIQCPYEGLGMRVDGGNLLTNGAGLAVTTTRMIDENIGAGFTTIETQRRIADAYGFDRLVVLQPLDGEGTGHVDMFATFTAVDTAVVASCDPNVDPVNASILDRNAEQLNGLPTARGPLRVFRIPMPPHDETCFRTWTNVVYANGTLVVPSYGDTDPGGEIEALNMYRRLLPGWNVTSVDCSRIIESGGALHCLTMNLAQLPQLPFSPAIDEPDELVPYLPRDQIEQAFGLQFDPLGNDASWREVLPDHRFGDRFSQPEDDAPYRPGRDPFGVSLRFPQTRFPQLPHPQLPRPQTRFRDWSGSFEMFGEDIVPSE